MDVVTFKTSDGDYRTRWCLANSHSTARENNHGRHLTDDFLWCDFSTEFKDVYGLLITKMIPKRTIVFYLCAAAVLISPTASSSGKFSI